MMNASHSSPSLCGKLDDSSHDTSVPSINFDCSICFELPLDPVVTMCGHLFCWSCLHQWITIQPVLQECPVCKACVKDKIIPLYGRGKAGFARNDIKVNHSFNVPRRPLPQQRYVPVTNVSQSTGFHHMPQSTGFQHDSFISQELHGSRGGHSMHSMTASGLLPALFGIHMLMSPEYSGTLNAPPGSMGVGGVVPQQHWLNVQQESVLYWLLFLLGCFASVCFLLF